MEEGNLFCGDNFCETGAVRQAVTCVMVPRVTVQSDSHTCDARLAKAVSRTQYRSAQHVGAPPHLQLSLSFRGFIVA